MKTSLSIDWITATRHIRPEEEHHASESVAWWTLWLARKAMDDMNLRVGALEKAKKIERGYLISYECESTGMKVSVPHPDRMTQGIKIIATGGLRQISHLYILKMLNAHGWKPTRIDLAFDIKNSKTEWIDIVSDVQEIVLDKEGWTHSLYRQGDGGTLGIGSRQSDIYCRIYNKAAERKISDMQWTRIEFELKGDIAKSSPELIIGNIKGYMKALLERRKLDLVPAIAKAFYSMKQGADLDIPEVGRKQTKTEEWLKHEVAQSLIKLARNDIEAARSVFQTYSAIMDQAEENKA